MDGQRHESPIVVALTGGIASGKSAVAKVFERCGAAVVDADLLARRVVEPGTPGLAAVINRFGSEFLGPDGTLDRKKLGGLVFSNPVARKSLEEILHPRIREAWLAELSNIRSSGKHSVAVYVVPLLFESGGAYPEIEKVVVVTAPDQIRIDRIIARDRCSPDEARARIAAQLPEELKRRRGDFVLHNDSSLAELERASEEIYRKLSSPSADHG